MWVEALQRSELVEVAEEGPCGISIPPAVKKSNKQ